MQFTLRPWSMNDLDSLVKHANNPRIAAFMTDTFPYPYTEADGIRFIEMATRDYPIHIFAIDIEGKAIGGIGIHPQHDILRKNAELGYWLSESYWGKGIITKAIQQITAWAFSQYNIVRIFARPFGNNAASIRVLEKTGFVLEARIKNNLYKNGEFLDECFYAIRRKEII